MYGDKYDYIDWQDYLFSETVSAGEITSKLTIAASEKSITR